MGAVEHLKTLCCLGLPPESAMSVKAQGSELPLPSLHQMAHTSLNVKGEMLRIVSSAPALHSRGLRRAGPDFNPSD
jgi:hypothetical protein